MLRRNLPADFVRRKPVDRDREMLPAGGPGGGGNEFRNELGGIFRPAVESHLAPEEVREALF
jgi:hypothetical protein